MLTFATLSLPNSPTLDSRQTSLNSSPTLSSRQTSSESSRQGGSCQSTPREGGRKVFRSQRAQHDGCSRPCKLLLELAIYICPDGRSRRDSGSGPAAASPEPEDRKWFRVHPIDDMKYYVRRDRGPEKSPCLLENVDTGLRRKEKYHQSTPIMTDRTLCMELPKGFDRDAFSNDCRVCFEKPSEIVLLPCRHGGLCMDCFRANFYRLPAHRGGCACPFCRTKIRQALQLHREAGAAVQYGYEIDVDIL